jgi:hypothetical protein
MDFSREQRLHRNHDRGTKRDQVTPWMPKPEHLISECVLADHDVSSTYDHGLILSITAPVAVQ